MREDFCQSCGMPLAEDTLLGTNADGTKNEHVFARTQKMETELTTAKVHVEAAVKRFCTA